jgi:hypothetical protein
MCVINNIFVSCSWLNKVCVLGYPCSSVVRASPFVQHYGVESRIYSTKQEICVWSSQKWYGWKNCFISDQLNVIFTTWLSMFRCGSCKTVSGLPGKGSESTVPGERRVGGYLGVVVMPDYVIQEIRQWGRQFVVVPSKIDHFFTIFPEMYFEFRHGDL